VARPWRFKFIGIAGLRLLPPALSPRLLDTLRPKKPLANPS
jgi:hypothetical protein